MNPDLSSHPATPSSHISLFHLPASVSFPRKYTCNLHHTYPAWTFCISLDPSSCFMFNVNCYRIFILHYFLFVMKFPASEVKQVGLKRPLQ
ncbi:hypothetical protein BDN71DRAFT_1449502 [Pleurotus eryngii]|uniref:Uncharacterized protein n=1 Tax=Pleurotus eryngii TaxID=5323 RepID=A0A9P6DEG3_PLEER|nr:hypothetical protein BDN71DRAFT_1449502 [Pleurotus eryngii]